MNTRLNAAEQPIRDQCVEARKTAQLLATLSTEKLSNILRQCPVKGWKIERNKDVGRSLIVL